VTDSYHTYLPIYIVFIYHTPCPTQCHTRITRTVVHYTHHFIPGWITTTPAFFSSHLRFIWFLYAHGSHHTTYFYYLHITTAHHVHCCHHTAPTATRTHTLAYTVYTHTHTVPLFLPTFITRHWPSGSCFLFWLYTLRGFYSAHATLQCLYLLPFTFPPPYFAFTAILFTYFGLLQFPQIPLPSLQFYLCLRTCTLRLLHTTTAHTVLLLYLRLDRFTTVTFTHGWIAYLPNATVLPAPCNAFRAAITFYPHRTPFAWFCTR